MNRKLASYILTAVLLSLGVVALAAQDAKNSSPNNTVTIEGLVRDIACPIQNPKSTATEFSMDCIIKCAKAGSPLGILTKDGTIYVPVTESMPDTGQQQLQRFAGKYVSATGKEFLRNGVHGIEINDIHAVDSVK